MSRFSLKDVFATPARRLTASGATIAVVIAVIASLLFQPFVGIRPVYAQDAFTLTPESADTLGVDQESAFILESKEPVDVSDVEDALKVEGASTPSFSQMDDRHVRIAFDEPMPASTVVKVSLETSEQTAGGEAQPRTYRWAFQTKGPFRVVSTVPGNHNNQTPVDTGIEVTFSHDNVDLQTFQDAFSITPSVNGRFEKHGRSLVFIPLQPLARSTSYIATINGSLAPTGSEETLGEDVRIEFETASSTGNDYVYFSTPFVYTKPTERPVIAYSGSSEEMRVELYRLASMADAVQVVKNIREHGWRQAPRLDLIMSGQPVSVTAITPEFADRPSGERVMLFPEPLEEGAYLAMITHGGNVTPMLLQSSSLAAYVMSASNETLIWAKDFATTPTPITAHLDGFDQRVEASREGIIHLPVQEGGDIALLSRAGTDVLVLGDLSGTVGSSLPTYTTYLYTDRPMYKPSDTARVWGLVTPKTASSRPAEVRVRLTTGSFCWYYCAFGTERVTPLVERFAKVDAQGFYSTDLPFAGLTPGGYTVDVMVGEEKVSTRYISISDYVKPLFNISITPDKTEVFEGDEVGFTIHAEYFDGTPANGMDMDVTASGPVSDNKQIRLDSAGNARVSYTPPVSTTQNTPSPDLWTSNQNWLYVSAKPVRAQEADMTTSASVVVYISRVNLSAQVLPGPQARSTVEWTVTPVVPGSFEQQPGLPNRTIQGAVFRKWWERTQTGTKYDPVTKRTYPVYAYPVEHTERLREFSLTTDARGKATLTVETPDPTSSYIVYAATQDDRGQWNTMTQYLWQYNDSNQNTDLLRFVEPDRRPEDYSGYATGEQVNLRVVKGDSTTAFDGTGEYLYVIAHDGIKTTRTSTDPSFSFTFTKELVPNASIYGAYFDGTGFARVRNGWYADGFEVYFDRTEAVLNVEVTPNNASVRPGEEVSLAVKVTDQAGLPVSGAEVNLNVVDEAYYALVEDSPDPINALYTYVSSGVFSTKATAVADGFEEFFGGGGAEKGGGGDRGRFDFKDAAAFIRVKTDILGRATATVKLPDNITSWRVTGQAIDAAKLRAGVVKEKVAATLPFFLNVVAKERYLQGDVPRILVRLAGTNVAPADSVSYRITIPDASVEETRTAPASQTMSFDLPNLPLGTHEMTVHAESKAGTDTITRSVTIVDSRVRLPVTDVVPVTNGVPVPGSDESLTTVRFVDEGRGALAEELLSLTRGWVARGDSEAVRERAAALYESAFGQKIQVEASSSYQTADGGIAVVSYASSDLDLSARVALLKDTSYDEAALRRYFGVQLNARTNDQPTLSAREAAESLAALAALGEPVLLDLEKLQQAEELPEDAWLWIAAGRMSVGDYEGARAIFRGLLEKTAVNENGRSITWDADDAVGAQALMVWMATALNEPTQTAFASAFDEMKNAWVYAPEQFLILSERLARAPEETTAFSYTLNGKRTRVELEPFKTVELTLTPEMRGALNLQVEEGSLSMVVSYDTAAINRLTRDDRVSITRTYTSVDGSSALKEGDLVLVTIKTTLPVPVRGEHSWYTVTDVVPSGLAAVSRWGGTYDGCIDYPEMNDQRVTLYVSNYPTYTCDPRIIKYYARVVSPGTFTAEPAILMTDEEAVTGVASERQTITVEALP